MALKRIKYIGPHPEVEIEWPLPGGRTIVKKGGTLDLPTRKAQEMARQTANWEIVEDPKPEDRRVHTQAKNDEPAEPPASKKGDG